MKDRRRDPGERSYIGVQFDCCSVYVRLYRRPDQDAYRGRCPRCLRPIVVPVGGGGSDARFLRAR